MLMTHLKHPYCACALKTCTRGARRTQRPATHGEMLHQVVSLVVLILHLSGSTNSALLPRAQKSGFGSAEHVIIFGCDGFGMHYAFSECSSSFISVYILLHWHDTMDTGGMYLENATSFLPNVNKFYTDGAHTTRARDQMPSVSAPNLGNPIAR